MDVLPSVFGNKGKKGDLAHTKSFIADERSRTSTGLSPQAPEACASASSATSAANITIATFSDQVKTFYTNLQKRSYNHILKNHSRNQLAHLRYLQTQDERQSV